MKDKVMEYSYAMFHIREVVGRSQMLFKVSVLKRFSNFTGKWQCRSLFLMNLWSWKGQHFFKKRLQHKCFPVKFAEFLRAPFSTEQLRWLLLKSTNFLIFSAFFMISFSFKTYGFTNNHSFILFKWISIRQPNSRDWNSPNRDPSSASSLRAP